jgi:ethanolamine ammonia-lyase large subunit
MISMRTILLSTAIVLALVTPGSAHYKFRIVGTVTKITVDEIAVKQLKDNAVVEMDIDKQTKVVRDGKTAGRNQIKIGGSVVIDALGDDILSLTATEIRLVPPIHQP